MSPSRARLVGCVLAACCLAGAAGARQQDRLGTPLGNPLGARPWPHEESGLPVRANVRFAAFENGVRCAWSPVAREQAPGAGVALWLHVAGGAAVERPEQQGMAHLLEHLLFRGTARWPDGAIDAWGARHGLAAGGDLNAFTDWDETIFLVDLPPGELRARPELLDEALSILRGMVEPPLFTEEALASELAIVAAEQRERGAPEERVEEELRRVAWHGSLLAERDVLGDPAVRARWTRADVLSFHRAWYRPERVTLVASGTLPDDVLARFERAFADLRADGDPPAPPPLGEVTPTPLTHVASVAGADQRTLVLRWAWPAVPAYALGEPGLVAALRKDLVATVLDRRLQALVADEPDRLWWAACAHDPAVPIARVEALEVRVGLAPDGDADAALRLVRREVDALLAHPLRPHELRSAQRLHLDALDDAIAQEAERLPEEEADWLLAMAEDRLVDFPTASLAPVLAPALVAVDSEAFGALAHDLLGGAPSILLVGPGVEPTAADALRAAWDARPDEPIEARPWRAPPPFAYVSRAAEAGEVALRLEGVDDAWREVRFANGVRLLHTPSPGSRAEVRAHFLGGRAHLARERWMLPWLAESVFLDLGLSAHDPEELARVLEAHDVDVELWVDDDAILLGGECARDELLLQCELCCAWTRHAAWGDAEAWRLFVADYADYYRDLVRDPFGAAELFLWRELFGDPPLRWFPDPDELRALSLSDVRDWLQPELAGAPLVVTVWGGTEEEVEAAVARTFGALPVRRAVAGDGAPPSLAPRPGLRRELPLAEEGERALVVLVVPLDARADDERAWSGNLLGAALRERLDARVRDELGYSYGADVVSQASPVFSELGYLEVTLIVDPADADAALAAALREVEALGREGLGADELRGCARTVGALHAETYWLDVLSAEARRAGRAQRWADEGRFYDRVRTARVNRLAREVLVPERTSTAILRPRR